MWHHGPGDYKTAASNAAKVGRAKMEAIIEKGRQNAVQVIEQVQSQVPTDRIALANALTIVPVDGRPESFGLRIKNEYPTMVHEHALGQIAEKAGLYSKFMNDLRELSVKEKKEKDDPWAQELIAHNLNTLLQHTDGRHLIRSVKTEGVEEVRGFLSDRYRRLDSRPLLDAFMKSCTDIGAVPVDGYALDTRVRLRAVLPYVFEPVENEVMLFGIQWGNSDFGNGGHCLSLFNIRVMCTNTAICDEVLRQVHLGKRLEDNITYSRKTYELDTQANVSAMKDLVYDALSAEKVNGYLEQIKIAAEDQIDAKDITRILKTKLNKGEAEKVAALMSGPDVINLPPGQSTYRLSNAISFFAQTEGISRNRQLDLQRIAGELVPVAMSKAREV